jgi:hypothetical protein
MQVEFNGGILKKDATLPIETYSSKSSPVLNKISKNIEAIWFVQQEDGI